MTNELTTETNPVEDFQAKVIEKLRDNIREMLPDDVLAGLMQRAIDEQFFKERTVYKNYRNETVPSWFVEKVCSSAESYITKYVEDYIKENKETIDKALQDYLTQERLAVMFGAAIASRLQSDMFNEANRIINTIRNDGY